MSIVALMQDAAAARKPEPLTRGGQAQPRVGQERPAAAQPPASPIAAIADELARYIPSEAIGLYLAGLPFLLGASGALEGGGYTGRWIWAGLVGLFAVLYGVGVFKAEVERRGERFRWPPKRTLIIVFAFGAWVVLIPGSPFAEFGWYTPALGALIGLGATALLSLFTLWFGGPEA